MAPMASPQTITIISNARLLSVTKPDQAPPMPALPKYAVGLFESKNGPGPRKRKRLTHLTPEEKIMRRKLKNRVAAQTARDRKKMRMETLEETLQKVQNQARELLNVNMQLLARAESLESENQVLREKLGITTTTTAAKTESTDQTATVIGQQKQNLHRIKTEFDETLEEIQIPDSILSPDESSADENEVTPKSSRKRKSLNRDDEATNDVKKHRVDDVTTMIDMTSCDVTDATVAVNDVIDGRCAMKRESPMPAAGSYPAYPVDPLHSNTTHLPVTTATVNSVTDNDVISTASNTPSARCNDVISASSSSSSDVMLPLATDELLGLLDEIADDYESNRGPSGSPTQVTSSVTSSSSTSNSIQVDHIYSKPPKTPLIQLKQRKTKLIKQNPTMTSQSPLIKVDFKSLPTTPIVTSSNKPGSLDVSNLLKQVMNSTQSSNNDVIMTSSPTKMTSSDDIKPPMLCDVKQEPDFTDSLFTYDVTPTSSPDNFEAEIEDFLNSSNFSPPPLNTNNINSDVTNEIFSVLGFGDDNSLFPQLA